ncbi:hypothetical protein NL349_27920, partial [Klebsiella pneumoniae]|nr:hypothetical protein [Klebsiella pneumoniae]
SAEYTKDWAGLKNPFFLNAAAITGNVTWSEQKNSKNTYLVNTDYSGDGASDDYRRIYLRGTDYSYRPEEFGAITGNLDIPVRFGATL